MADNNEFPTPGENRALSLLRLFWAFFCLGLTAFGGPAMVAYIGDMSVDKYAWLSRKSFKEGVVIAQTIPGATAMQTAAYVGLRSRGIAGAAATYLGFGLPAFILMLIMSAFYSAYHKSPISVSIFQGMQVIVVAIIARAAFTFGRSTIKSWWDGGLVVLIAAYLVLGGNPVLAIFAGAIIGLLLYRKTVGSASTDQHREEQPAVSNNIQVLSIVLAGALLLALLLIINRRLFDLALLMLKVDALAFGGGFASVPVMLHSIVEVNKWVDARTFMDGIAMGQITPGPIVITATFIGYQVAGVLGSLVATIAVFFPSFVVLVYVVPRFDRIKKNRYFQMAIKGILVSFVGLLLAITYRFIIIAPWSPASIVISCVSFGALMLNVNIAWVVLPGAALSAFCLR